MPGLGLYASEDLDALVARYVEHGAPGGDPLARLTVVVPNSAVGQWFEQAVARRTGLGARADGIVANVDAIFPAGLLGRLLYGDHRALERWSTPALALELRALADARLSMTEALTRARVLERLVRQRGDELDDHLRAAGLGLEARLVERRAAAGDLVPHARFARDGVAFAAQVGSRVSVFACLTSPYGALLPAVTAALGDLVETEVYLPVPSRRLADGVGDDPDLVGRWGAPQRAHLALWRAAAGPAGVEWVPPAPRGPAVDLGGVPVSASVEVHRCVGLARQVEVARDVLSRLLDEEGLAAHHVRLVSLDPATVAALLGLYFASHDDDGPTLQFEVADPSVARPSARLDALRALLGVIESDQTVNDVTRLLVQPAVRSGLGLRRVDVDRVVELALEGRVSLGLDARASARRGVFDEGDDAGTWTRFVDRVTLASVFDPGRPVVDDEVDTLGAADDLEAIARLAVLIETLREASGQVGRSRSLADWTTDVGRWCDVIDHDDRIRDPSLERLVGDLSVLALSGGPPLSFADLRDLVESLAAATTGGSLIGRGGASLLSLGGSAPLPYEVTCVIGLDDDLLVDAASAGAELGEHRPTDSDRRSDVRAALVDLLASTRRRLLLFTDDRRIVDGGTLLPSLVLAEISEELSRAGVEVIEHRHPRHGFSRAESGGSDLATTPSAAVTADPVHAVVAATLAAGEHVDPEVDVALTRVAGEPAPPEGVVDVAALVAYFRHPQRVFLRDVFAGARLSKVRAAAPDVPFLDLGDSLARWSLRERLLHRALETGEPAHAPHQPDSALGSVAAGFRSATSQDLGLADIDALASHVRATLTGVSGVRDPRGLRPGLVRGRQRDVARGPVSLFATDHGPVILRALATSSFASHVVGAMIEVAAVTAEIGEPVTGVLVRLKNSKEAGEDAAGHPLLIVQWSGEDAPDQARQVLGRLLGLYDRRRDGLPMLFAETSLALGANRRDSSLADVVAQPDARWLSGGWDGEEPRGESLEEENRLMVPLDYRELIDVFDGAVKDAAEELIDALAPMSVTFHPGDVEWPAVVAT